MDPFVAEIRIVGFNFPPKGWAFCDGQLLLISQNTALFSLLGTFYGGSGVTTFALPYLAGCAALHAGDLSGGAGPGLSQRFLGEQSGSEATELLITEIPSHTHDLRGTGSPASTSVPGANSVLARSGGGAAYKQPGFGTTTQAHFSALSLAGGNLPHNNMMPSLVMNFVIALEGVFPPHS